MNPGRHGERWNDMAIEEPNAPLSSRKPRSGYPGCSKHSRVREYRILSLAPHDRNDERGYVALNCLASSRSSRPKAVARIKGRSQ